jgi:hypothetical protein
MRNLKIRDIMVLVNYYIGGVKLQSDRRLFFILVIVLIINIILLGKVGDLNSQIQRLRHEYNNLQSSISSISSNVNSSLDRFTREQSWITPVHVDDGKTKVDGEKGLAVLNWQIKDFVEGAEVVFHYRQNENGEFETVLVQNKGDGFFEVEIPFDIRVEPYWEIRVSKRIVGGTKTSAHMAEAPGPDYQSVSYYVSMKTGDVTRSSEIAHVDVAYLAKIKYETIVGHVDINNDRYHISLVEPHNGSRFQSVTVKLYNGVRLIAEKAMEVRDVHDSRKTYGLDYVVDSKDVSRLVIHVEYEGGKTFEKEIFI